MLAQKRKKYLVIVLKQEVKIVENAMNLLIVYLLILSFTYIFISQLLLENVN